MKTYEVETLARGWPWSFDQVKEASELARDAGWTVAELVNVLDSFAGSWGPSVDPVRVIQGLIALRATR